MESIVVTAPLHVHPAAPSPAPAADLLRELIEVQREQLTTLRALQAGADDRGRWRGVLSRHAEDFPTLSADCRAVLPLVERAYLSAMAELTADLSDPDADFGHFGLNEMLDRHVPRLGQLWSLLTQVGQLANAAPMDVR